MACWMLAARVWNSNGSAWWHRSSCDAENQNSRMLANFKTYLYKFISIFKLRTSPRYVLPCILYVKTYSIYLCSSCPCSQSLFSIRCAPFVTYFEFHAMRYHFIYSRNIHSIIAHIGQHRAQYRIKMKAHIFNLDERHCRDGTLILMSSKC